MVFVEGLYREGPQEGGPFDFLSPSPEEATQGQGYAFFHVKPCVVVGPCNSELMKNSSPKYPPALLLYIGFLPLAVSRSHRRRPLPDPLLLRLPSPLCALLLNSHQQRKKVPRDSKAKKRTGEKDIQQKKRAKKGKATFTFFTQHFFQSHLLRILLFG